MSTEATVVTPILRQVESWLGSSVRSVLMQTMSTEIIVITFPLTPLSNEEILKCFRQQHAAVLVYRQRGKDFANALNEGIRLAWTNRVGYKTTSSRYQCTWIITPSTQGSAILMAGWSKSAHC